MRATMLCLVFGSALMAVVLAESEPNAFAPVLDMKDTDGKSVDVYKGFIVSDEDTVSLVPELKSSDKDEIGGARFICGYRIYSDDYDIPFEAQVISHTDGRAKLKLKHGVKLADFQRQKYKFEIAAFDCGSPTLHSEKAHVVVRVIPAPELNTPPLPEDLKKLIEKNVEVAESKSTKKELKDEPAAPAAPVLKTTTVFPKLSLPKQGGESFFDKPSYIIAMREATLYDSILKLRPAADKTGIEICGYEIVTPDVPFSVDGSGNVKNTKALEYDVQMSYILSVVAKRCDKLVSKPAVITVQVSKICTNGWKELPTDEEYKAGSKAIQPFAETWLDTCETSCDQTETVSVTVSLESQGQINTCQHNTYSIQSQRNTCGASQSTVELLPQGQPWTEGLKPVEGHEAAYKFDGKTAVKVPSTTSNHTLGNFFTLSFWMDHGEEKKDGHKENILCNADGDGMNRHHYSLFVHNCRLVFLLRKEADQVTSMDKFMPAEWRWTIPHVCDSHWHHYAISVDYPNVKLYVDGQRIQDDKDVVEVIDDWAMHTSSKVHFQQLSVGACWQGSSKTMGQYFTGSLAGVSMVNGTTETERVIKCLNSCGEKLKFTAMELLQVGMSVSFNTELTELTITGNHADDVKSLLRHVEYTNTNGDPKPGYRSLHITTNMTCDDKPLTIPRQTIPILVSAVTDPEITISGSPSKLRTKEEFGEGVDLFTELMILSSPNKQLEGQENRINKLTVEDVNYMQKDLKKKLMLDRCEVRVDQKMDPNQEKLRLPTQLLIKYLMDTKEFDQGFDITGSETYQHYEEVLRETFYVNKNADGASATRKFTVRCSDMNGRFKSQPFSVTLKMEVKVDQSKLLYADPVFDHAKESSLRLKENSFQQSVVPAASTSGTVIAVVVICVVFLLIVIIIAVMRIRTVQRTRRNNPNVNVEDGPEMEWDNSTLNITVNPLESDKVMEHLKSSEYEGESDEEVMSTDDEEDPINKEGLEWDNSLSY